MLQSIQNQMRVIVAINYMTQTIQNNLNGVIAMSICDNIQDNHDKLIMLHHVYTVDKLLPSNLRNNELGTITDDPFLVVPPLDYSRTHLRIYLLWNGFYYFVFAQKIISQNHILIGIYRMNGILIKKSNSGICAVFSNDIIE